MLNVKVDSFMAPRCRDVDSSMLSKFRTNNCQSLEPQFITHFEFSEFPHPFLINNLQICFTSSCVHCMFISFKKILVDTCLYTHPFLASKSWACLARCVVLPKGTLFKCWCVVHCHGNCTLHINIRQVLSVAFMSIICQCFRTKSIDYTEYVCPPSIPSLMYSSHGIHVCFSRWSVRSLIGYRRNRHITLGMTCMIWVLHTNILYIDVFFFLLEADRPFFSRSMVTLFTISSLPLTRTLTPYTRALTLSPSEVCRCFNHRHLSRKKPEVVY